MSKTPTYGDPGTLSHGTMNPEHIVPVFIAELRRLDHKNSHLDEIEQRVNEEEKAHSDEDSEHKDCYWNSLGATEDLETLFDMLDTHALPYFYFGVHPGHGSDYGFWLGDWEDSFEGLQVGDLSEVPEGYEGEVIHVNDHGNVSLYVFKKNGSYSEIWSVV